MDANEITDRNDQINWLTLECYDLATQDGEAPEKVAHWEKTMRGEGMLPKWYDQSDRDFMINQLSD